MIAPVLSAWLALGCVSTGSATEPTTDDAPRIQVAILLDVSGSMKNLLDQARTHLWRMVNEWVDTEQDGRSPDVEVALYSFGRVDHGSDGHVLMHTVLTTDLDLVSEELFALGDSAGGDERCGLVIRRALEDLAWSARADDLRVILIAGNESFHQGEVDVGESCRDAIARGIMVNTFFCGTESDGVKEGWKAGAIAADGEYIAINMARRVPEVAAPQDKLILTLNKRLNDTYIPFGPAGRKAVERQRVQDKRTRQASRYAAIERTRFKASRGYDAREWDLVDALLAGSVRLRDIDEKHLPEEMRGLSIEEKQAYVKGKIDERDLLRRRLAELTGERRRHVESKLAQMGGAPTLGQAVVAATRRQAQKRRFAAQADAGGN